MPDTPVDTESQTLEAHALDAITRKDLQQAQTYLSKITDSDPLRLDIWIKRAALYRGMAQVDNALAMIFEALKINPRDFVALMMQASIFEQQKFPDVGEYYAIAIAQAPPESDMDANIHRAYIHAIDVRNQHQQRLYDALQKTVSDVFDKPSETNDRKMDQFFDNILRRRKTYHSEPSHFRFPDLPTIEFYDRVLFPWIAEFETHYGAIKTELIAVLNDGFEGSEPYVQYPDHMPLDQWRALNKNPDWSAFHLYAKGKRIAENADRCPNTIKALSLIPQPHIAERGPCAMFSVLKPHTRIPPHTGVSNTRLLVHLPLIVPEKCGFRVGNVTRSWIEGQAFVFDDTIEHEAWNESDHLRVVLIADLWTPYLSELDQKAITKAMEYLNHSAEYSSNSE